MSPSSRHITLAIVLAPCLLLGLWVLWLLERNPITALPPPEYNLQVERQILAPQNRRHVEHITLHTTLLGDIGIVISLPDPLPAKKLPLLIILGGLGSGEDNIRYVGEAGNNAVIGYDWPMPVQFYNGIDFVKQLPDLHNRLMNVPGQVTSAISWLASQSWADDQHISLLGFSLGALAAPAIQDLTAYTGHHVSWTILAYGGAPLSRLFAGNPHIKPEWMRYALAPFIEVALRPIEPTQHLPYLSGHFLILEGNDDSLISPLARANLREAVPEPKTVITFEGNHMGVGPDKMELLQKIIDASKKWLMENGAVNLI